MVSTQGEIRVGPSHQARLPEFRSAVSSSSDPELSKEREELRWLPAMALDGDLLMYLRAARSMAAFAGMCDGGSADDGCVAASRDDTTINALDVLHDSGYDPGKALQALVKCPVPKGIDKKWCEEETKRFVKGLRQFGKNFFRIRKDLLPHKDTSELVEFYYLWKKTPGANNNRPHRRRRAGSLRRIRNTRQTRGGTPHNSSPSAQDTNATGGSRPSPNPKEQGEGSSASEEENSEDDSDSRDQSINRCQHCFSTSSRELAVCGPKERALVCEQCRQHYAKNGSLPPVNRTDAPYLFRPVQTDSPDGSPGRMRTRNKAKETPTKGTGGGRPKRSSGSNTPDPEVDKKGGGGGCKSPGASSTRSNSPGGAKKRLCVDKIKTESSNKPRKRPPTEAEGEEETKRKRERPDSPSESVTSDSGSVADETEAAEPGNLDLGESNPPCEAPADDNMPAGTVKEEEEAPPPPSPLSDNSQLPVFKVEDCNVVFNVGVPKKEPLEPVSVKEEQNSECNPTTDNQTFNQPPPPSPSVPEEDVKIKIPDIKPKPDDNFFSLSVLSDRVIDPPGSGPLPKAFDEIPMPGKLSVKREGLFEPVKNESVIVPMMTPVDNFVPKEEMNANSPPPLQAPSLEQRTVTTQSQTVSVKPEANEDSMSNETSGPPPSDLTAPSLSPLPLTSYAPNSPRQPPTEQQHHDDKTGIIVPAFSVASEEKPTLNIPSVPSALSASSHHSGFSSYYHPHFHPHQGKMNPSPPSYLNSGPQSEPQNLKIKQEVIPPDSVQPSADPLQSLKEVKVPGYSNSSSISQPLMPTSMAPNSTQADLSTTTQSSSPFQSVGPSVDSIKKEPESFHPIRTNTPSKSPSVKPLETTPIASPAPRSSITHTPPFPPPPPPVSHSATNLIAPSPTSGNPPSSLPQPMHPSQQPSPLSRVSPGHLAHPHAFVPTMPHPHHALIHHPLFAAAAAHAAAVHHSPYHPHHPYAGYPPYPFPYGPYPIPQPVPPPQKRDSLETTMMTSHHSSVTTRSLREVETRGEESNHHTTQEITQTHHHSTSHHSSVHHHSGEKQPLTISHSTTSSSSASVQHKINSTKRGTSPAATQSSCHVSATLSQTTSSSLSTNHQHSHHHQSVTGERLSPGMGSSPLQLGSRGPPVGVAAKPHPHMMVHPHHALMAPTSSLEALRAHAQAAAHASHPGGGMLGHPAFLSPDGARGPEPEVKPEPLTVSGDEGGGAEEEEVPSPTQQPRGPSPEPKIEDSECHRSQSAIFLRHWNRGDYNSCCRTDLTFKPVPDSKLARKREERIRKQAEKEREEREKAQARKIATPEKPEASKPPSRGPIESISSPYDRFNPRAGYPDTPALRQLSEYARPHGGFSPVTLQRSAALGLPPQCIDPMLHYQLNSINSMYGPAARDRYPGLGPGGLHQFSQFYPGPGGPSQAAALSQLERERLERLGIPAPGPSGSAPPPAGPPPPPQPTPSSALDAERLTLTTDPMVRLQMAGISPEYHAHTHAHTHAHSHTHLHLHPGQQAGGTPSAPAPPDPATAFPLPATGSGGYPRPSLLPPREAALALHHPSELLGRPYADQLAHQAAAHEHIQRQMMLERERFPHPSLVAHHEEYLRQQRDRELKVRALEEAARGSRP